MSEQYFTRPNVQPVITNIGTTPEQRQMSTSEFKAKFDEMPEAIQQYIKETLLVELDAFKQEFMTHLAENATLKTVHGLRYETGKWTPKLEGATVAGNHAYETNIGRYVKINNKVTLYGELTLNSKDSAMSGAVRITGLPFVVGGGFIGSLSIGRLRGVNITSSYLIYSMPINTTTRCDIYKTTPTGLSESVSSTEILNNFSIRFSAEYYIT